MDYLTPGLCFVIALLSLDNNPYEVSLWITLLQVFVLL